jgi:hypothetical protein
MSLIITPQMFAKLDITVQKTLTDLLDQSVPVAEPVAKSKRVLSPEHLAKLKAGREAKQALKRLAKLAAAEDLTLPESIPVIETVIVTVPEPVAVTVAEPEPVSEQPVSEPVQEAKPKRVLSPEHLAKMKAGRELKRLLKAAAAEMEAEPVSAPPPTPVTVQEPVAVQEPIQEAKPKRVLSPEHLAKMKAGRELKKLLKAAAAEMEVAPVPVAAPEPVAAPVPEPVQEPVAEPVPVAVAVAEAKPKRVLSPEHLAKMKAGREAKKALKNQVATTAGPLIEFSGRPTTSPLRVDPPLITPETLRPTLDIVSPEIEVVEYHLVAAEPVAVQEQPVAVQEQPVAAEVKSKKRGPKKLSEMTPDELLNHNIKVAERKAKRVTFQEAAAV